MMVREDNILEGKETYLEYLTLEMYHRGYGVKLRRALSLR